MCYIYETNHIAKSRKTKWCEECGKTINKGEPSITVTEFCDEFINTDICSDECLEKYKENYGKPRDDEDEEDYDEEDE